MGTVFPAVGESLLNGEAGTLEMQLRWSNATRDHRHQLRAVFGRSGARRRGGDGKRQQAHRDHRQRGSPIALHADKVLIFSHESPSFFPSLVAATAIAESLVAHLLALEGAGAVEQLAIAEQSLHAKGAYVP